MSRNNKSNIKNELSGITTGFKELDDMTSGLQKSDLIILSARPAMGKTAFALSIARNAALKDGATIMYFSLEMWKESLEQRLLAIESKVEMQKLQKGCLDPCDQDDLNTAQKILSNADIIIEETLDINTMEMKDKCRRLKAKKKLDLIIIDYLQLINIEGEPLDSREREITAISHELKLLAREMDCPVLVLSTLSRKPEFRTDHRPKLSDMMPEDYGKNADVIIFLYRDEYYNENTDCPNECEVIVAKQRSGRTGTVKLSWLNKIMRFEDFGDIKEIRKKKKYINLNVHSNYTAYETVMTPEEIVEYAVRDGASAVALTDKNSVGGFMSFSRAADKHKDEGFKPIYGVQINCLIEEDSPTLITLLAKNQTGLRNMYKIITAGYMNPGEPDSWPCVSRQIVEENHEGLLIGMDLRWERLYEADISELEEEFRFADYVGIRPWSERPAAHNDGRVIGEEQLKEAATRMIRLLNELGKCPVAVSGANAITKEDELCFDILRAVLSPAQEADFAFMKSTAEVLEDYQFLGKKLAERIVIDNTNAINKLISEDIAVDGKDKTLIEIPDAMKTVETCCEEALRKRYGDNPPENIKQRLEKELGLIRKSGCFASYYLVLWRDDRCPIPGICGPPERSSKDPCPEPWR